MKEFEEEPAAYRVFCPKGHKYDYLLFSDIIDAQDQSDVFAIEDNFKVKVEPLYAKKL